MVKSEIYANPCSSFDVSLVTLITNRNTGEVHEESIKDCQWDVFTYDVLEKWYDTYAENVAGLPHGGTYTELFVKGTYDTFNFPLVKYIVDKDEVVVTPKECLVDIANFLRGKMTSNLLFESRFDVDNMQFTFVGSERIKHYSKVRFKILCDCAPALADYLVESVKKFIDDCNDGVTTEPVTVDCGTYSFKLDPCVYEGTTFVKGKAGTFLLTITNIETESFVTYECSYVR